VEAGQALVIAVVLPGLIWAQRHRWEPRFVQVTSVLLVATGLAWLVERLWLT
jgi:hypothetical protein